MTESVDQSVRGIIARKNPNESLQISFPQFPTAIEVVNAFYKRHEEEKDPEKQMSDFEKAQRKNPENNLERADLLRLASESLAQMARLEEASDNPNRWLNITEEEARMIKRIIVFSAPGTYNQPIKDDRYKDKIWAWGMDRMRVDQAVRLGIVLTGIAREKKELGVFNSPGFLNAVDSSIKQLIPKVREMLKKNGIRFVYVARPDEEKAIRIALRQPNSLVPEELVDFIAGPHIDNTIDQVKEVGEYLRRDGLIEGDGVVFVAHGPQLIRMAGNFGKYQSIPKGVQTFFEPVSIPRLGMNEYPLMETKGRLAYTITGDSAKQSNNYKILGVKTQV